MGTMRAGDADNDNLVNSADFNILKNSYGKGSGDPGYDDRADFNGDNLVSAADFNLLKANFGTAGADPLRPARAPGQRTPATARPPMAAIEAYRNSKQ